MLKILSWNIRQGGGSRVRAIAQRLVDSQAQILVLSEYRNNESGIQLRTLLLKGGYRYQYVTASPRNENSVLVASSIAGAVRWHPAPSQAFAHNLIWVRFSAFTLIGGYWPHKKKHQLFETVADYMAQEEEALVVAGDFNTGINHVDQVGKSFWHQDEIKRLLREGLCDAFREKRGDVKEYSWYSHQGNGYRYDQTYVSKELMPIVKDCYYLHEWREQKLSDHSPMMLELG